MCTRKETAPFSGAASGKLFCFGDSELSQISDVSEVHIVDVHSVVAESLNA